MGHTHDSSPGTADNRQVQLLHLLILHKGAHNAVVVSQAKLAQMLDCSQDEISATLSELTNNNWIQRITLTDGCHAYAVNERIRWDQPQDDRTETAEFSARVIAARDDQEPAALDDAPLRRIPALFDET